MTTTACFLFLPCWTLSKDGVQPEKESWKEQVRICLLEQFLQISLQIINVVDKISISYIYEQWHEQYYILPFFKFNYFLFTADCSVPKAPDNVVCSGRITRLKILTVTLLLLYLLISNLRNILMKCKSTYKNSI